jgi:hypothetical protein
MNPLLDDDLTGPRPPVFLSALRITLGRAPIWIACWLVPLVLSLVVAVPWRGFYAEILAHRYEPRSQLASLDETLVFDHRAATEALERGTAGMGAALALVVMLFGAFSGGGWLQVFLERTQGHSLRRFLWGGARYFWRFLRVWIVSLLTLALFSWACYGWPWKLLLRVLVGAVDGDLEVVRSEWTATVLTWGQDGLYASLVAALFAWGDFTRARIALQDARSALWAGLCTWGLFLIHPLRTLRPMALLLALEASVVLVLGRIAHGIDRGLDAGSGAGALLLLFALGQLALLAQGIARGARYHAAAQVSKQIVPPPAQPDPWAGRVGGPGGPQYPIDVTDDYGVSV